MPPPCFQRVPSATLDGRKKLASLCQRLSRRLYFTFIGLMVYDFAREVLQLLNGARVWPLKSWLHEMEVFILYGKACIAKSYV